MRLLVRGWRMESGVNGAGAVSLVSDMTSKSVEQTYIPRAWGLYLIWVYDHV